MGTTFSITEADRNDDITVKLQSRQTLITVLNWLQAFGVVYLICQTLVVGYAVVTTPSGTTAVPHAIWMLAPFLVCFVVAHTTRFEVGLYLDTLTSGMRYTYFVLAIGLIANGVAMGLFVWELVQGVSNFYVQSFGYLIATVVVTGIFIVCEILLLFAVWVLDRDINHAWDMGWKPRYQKHDPQYTQPPKEKLDDQERLMQGPRSTTSTKDLPEGDFDIEEPPVSSMIRTGLRNTRLVVQGRKLLK
jgi:hypothetical protein